MSTDGSNLEESSEYSKYGIRDAPQSTIATTFGQTRTFARLSGREIAFLIISNVNILTALGLTLYRFINVIKTDPENSDFTFALLLIINAAFCLFYVFHGVLREKIYELYVLILAIIVVLVYCIVEYAFFNVEGRTTLKLVRLILICVLAPPNIVLAAWVAKHFGYLQFRIVGASEYLQHLYTQASIFSCLLKFDVQVTASFVVLVLRDGTDINLFQKIALGIGMPYSLLWNVLGWVALRKEIKAVAWIFAVTGIAKPSYYIYMIIREYNRIGDNNGGSDTIIYSLLGAGTLALLIWLILMIELVTVCKNFGKGLKERAFDVLATENTSLITGRRVHR